MSIDQSFYKNVFLLAQVVPPSYEFNKHFKKGMFDKPNTAGFIHVSHYLLTIHNGKRFQSMVTWPIICKEDEKQYRTEIKHYLTILSEENPNINFPLVLTSHLFHAGGPKILIIMWRISQIALRAYIEREYQIKLFEIPRPGLTEDLTKTYFRNVNRRRDKAISEIYKKSKQIADDVEAYAKNEINEINGIKADIFEKIENIKKLMSLVPVNPLVAERLMDIDDTEIIDMWKESISENIKYVLQKHSDLNEVRVLSDRLKSLVLSLFIDPKILDAKELPKINTEIDSGIYSYSTQELYENNSLVVRRFVIILTEVLDEIGQCIKTNGLLDLSKHQLKMKENCETITVIQTAFEESIAQAFNILTELQSLYQKKSCNFALEADFLQAVNKGLLLISPNINISITQDAKEIDFADRLWPSPIKNAHKELFKRYRRAVVGSPKLSMQKFNYSDSVQSSTINWKSPQRHSTMCKKSPSITTVSPKYSRLFSGGDSKIYCGENNAASTPLSPRLSTTPKRSGFSRVASKSQQTLDVAAKSLFDLSCQVTSAVASLCKSPRRNVSHYN